MINFNLTFYEGNSVWGEQLTSNGGVVKFQCEENIDKKYYSEKYKDAYSIDGYDMFNTPILHFNKQKADEIDVQKNFSVQCFDNVSFFTNLVNSNSLYADGKSNETYYLEDGKVYTPDFTLKGKKSIAAEKADKKQLKLFGNSTECDKFKKKAGKKVNGMIDELIEHIYHSIISNPNAYEYAVNSFAGIIGKDVASKKERAKDALCAKHFAKFYKMMSNSLMDLLLNYFLNAKDIHYNGDSYQLNCAVSKILKTKVIRYHSTMTGKDTKLNIPATTQLQFLKNLGYVNSYNTHICEKSEDTKTGFKGFNSKMYINVHKILGDFNFDGILTAITKVRRCKVVIENANKKCADKCLVKYTNMLQIKYGDLCKEADTYIKNGLKWEGELVTTERVIEWKVRTLSAVLKPAMVYESNLTHRRTNQLSGVPKFCRQFYLLNGEDAWEVDAKCSQPTLLLKNCIEDGIECSKFKDVIENGDIHQECANALGVSRNEGKTRSFVDVYFGIRKMSDKTAEKYSKVFGKEVIEYIKSFRMDKNCSNAQYKAYMNSPERNKQNELWCHMQSSEAEIWNGIYDTFKEQYPMFQLYDAIICTKDAVQIIADAYKTIMMNYGINAQVHIEKVTK